MPSFEIEIKSLLQSKENADRLIEKLKNSDPKLILIGQSSQLNHYFVGGDINKLSVFIHKYLDELEGQDFHHIVNNGVNISVRTRQTETKVILVIKATLDETTSSNGTARIEFEKDFAQKMSLSDLDQLLLDSDFIYQAKWSRDRQEFEFNPKNAQEKIVVCLDKNAGYGYLAEFELVIDDATKAEESKTYLRSIMAEVGAQELQQDRLERMFAFYNQNWQDYYGTEKTFDVK
jgi:adenylate cyclase class IV